jgi:hypothetical protein
VKIREPHSLRRESIKVGSLDFAAEASNVGPSHIVGHDQENVRSVIGSLGLRKHRSPECQNQDSCEKEFTGPH